MYHRDASEKNDLIVVIPVYNEQDCVAATLNEWSSALKQLSIGHQIHVYNDGSSDETEQALLPFEGRANFRVVHQANAGHGPTILRAYRSAAAQSQWIFQVDSDGEIAASEFASLWQQRENQDLVIGYRQNRNSELDRKIITGIARIAVRALFGSGIRDVNCPYRLMKTDVFGELFGKVPDSCFAPNVVLSGLSIRNRLRIRQLPVAFAPRQTGQVSIAGLGLWKAAIRSFRQTYVAARSEPKSLLQQRAEQAASGTSEESGSDIPSKADTPLTTGTPSSANARQPFRSANFDYLVVGSGLYGSVMAERLRSAGKRVLVIEKRDHVGGNCATYIDPTTKVPIHQYGTHIFHTNSQRVWDYIRSFGDFNDYRHRVLTRHGGRDFQMPINLNTINQFFGLQLAPHQVEGFLQSKRVSIPRPRNFEEKALSQIGPELYEAFIRGYTYKQWNHDPQDLPASTFNRLPIRSTADDNYFDDQYQGVPKDGYTPIFNELLRGIPVEVGTDFLRNRDAWTRRCQNVIYTGPMDAYFNHRFGRLNWRSVRFDLETLPQSDFQGTSVLNYAETTVPYTRIHEPQHLHPERTDKATHTVIMREYSQLDHEAPYYPVGASVDQAKVAQYRALVQNEKRVVFGGRLAEYKYYDMHQVIGAALHQAEKILGTEQQRRAG